MADMSSICQELSLTVKVYDFSPSFPNLLWLWCFFGFVSPYVLRKPFFKCDQLACFAAYWAEQLKAKAESEGVWCGDSPVCVVCVAILYNSFCYLTSVWVQNLPTCKGWSRGMRVFCGN